DRLDDQTREGEVGPLAEGAHAVSRDRQDGAPQALHVVLIEPRGARNKAGGLHDVRRTALVDVDVDMRMVRDDGPGGAAMVQVNVRQENGPHVGQRPTKSPQTLLERGKG